MSPKTSRSRNKGKKRTTSHVLVQLAIELVDVGSREQFRVRCLPKQRQRCWRSYCNKTLVSYT